jgi:hypothetical protein
MLPINNNRGTESKLRGFNKNKLTNGANSLRFEKKPSCALNKIYQHIHFQHMQKVISFTASIFGFIASSSNPKIK